MEIGDWPSSLVREQEFAKANEKARSEKTELEARNEELTDKLNQDRAGEALVERVPKVIKTYMEAFQSLDVRQQKAQLQTILKSAYIYKDGRIVLEFRGKELKTLMLAGKWRKNASVQLPGAGLTYKGGYNEKGSGLALSCW
jgi:hypothetical protein